MYKNRCTNVIKKIPTLTKIEKTPERQQQEKQSKLM